MYRNCSCTTFWSTFLDQLFEWACCSCMSAFFNKAVMIMTKIFCFHHYLFFGLFFAGPRRGRPTRGFSIFVRTYVRLYVRPYVRPSVSNSFSLLLLDQYTSDPQYFYRFRTPYKMTIRGAD